MMYKIVSELIIHSPIMVPKEQRSKEPAENTSGVPTKDPPKVRSVKEGFPKTQ